LRTVLEHMGAERGCLLVERGEALEVEAEAHGEGGQVQVRHGQGTPVEQRLPASIAHYVSHTRESVVLEDAAAAGGRFGADPYIQRAHPRSVLCMPLVHLGRLQGLLYLENRLAPGAFTPGRFAGLQLLASQVSISLENARLYRAAQQAVQVRDEFLSVASHELKSPLTSLFLQAQRLARLLQRGSREPPRLEVVSGVLETLNRQTQRLARLGEQLLDVSLLHSGRLELKLEPVDLGALVREVVERTGEQPGLAGYPVEVHVPEPAVGHWDRSRLEQVLLNLLTNAMKYGEGRPVRVRVEQDDGLVRLEVQDEGIGISSEDQVRIFERFERVTPTRHHYEGLGLGLYLTRQIVLAHGGSIRVRSAPGQGSTFTVELPREPRAECAIPRAPMGGEELPLY
jgi:signal transduction histidine kinase